MLFSEAHSSKNGSLGAGEEGYLVCIPPKEMLSPGRGAGRFYLGCTSEGIGELRRKEKRHQIKGGLMNWGGGSLNPIGSPE